MTGRMDWDLVLVEPNLAALQVAIDIKEAIEQIRDGCLPATEHLRESSLILSAIQIYGNALIQEVFVILNKIREDQEREYLEHKLQLVGLAPIAVIPEERRISEAWLKGISIKEVFSGMIGVVPTLERAVAKSNLQVLAR